MRRNVHNYAADLQRWPVPTHISKNDASKEVALLRGQLANEEARAHHEETRARDLDTEVNRLRGEIARAPTRTQMQEHDEELGRVRMDLTESKGALKKAQRNSQALTMKIVDFMNGSVAHMDSDKSKLQNIAGMVVPADDELARLGETLREIQASLIK